MNKSSIKATFSTLLITASFISGASWASTTPYYAIIDAGSGGSRVYLYKIDNTAPSSPTVTQITFSDNKIKPGISTDLSDCGGYIEPLLSSLSNALSAKGISQNQVTVSLQATAGMRVISPVEQTACYSAVRLQLQTMIPGVGIGPIQTIQGRYEGAYQWLTVNYLKGTLTTGQKTVGVLEVGGGSSQMTFESPGKLKTLDFITVPFGGKFYGLFSRSYTGLGGNFSREDATDDPNAFQVGFNLASGAIGTGNYKLGKKSARKTILDKPVGIPQQARMPPLSSFVGVGLYSNVALDLGLGNQISSNSIDEAGSSLAKTSYDQNTTNKFEFSRVYSAQLISEMIRTWFSPSRKLTVEDTIGGKEITWTLGAALFLNANGALPPQ